VIERSKDETSRREAGTVCHDFPLILPRSSFRRWLKVTVGRSVLHARPQLVNRFEAGELPRGRFLERAALAALADQYRKAGTIDRLATQHAQFWSRQDLGELFYDRTAERLQRQLFSGRHRPALDTIEHELAAGGFHTLVEIGCGTGDVLAHLQTRLPGLKRCIGLDLNSVQIARNRRRFAARAQLEFLAEDVSDWVQRNAQPGIAYFSYGGVFEYFTQEKFQDLLASIADGPPVLLALVEPIGMDHDMDSATDSVPFGREMSHSHAYPILVEAAGFEIAWRQESADQRSRWMMLVAQKRASLMAACSSLLSPGLLSLLV
jgi:SAM-dependent methyltransferase